MSLCCGQRAVKVSDSHCSDGGRRPLISRLMSFYSSQSQAPAFLDSVSCVYKSQLVSSEKKLLITLTWMHNLVRKGFDVEFFDGETTSSPSLCHSECSKHQVRMPKGYFLIDFNDYKIELCWDISAAEYENGVCELNKKFHLMIAIDLELCLKLGDTFNFEDDEKRKMIATSSKVASSVYFTRREKYFGNTFYATKAKFCDGGENHDIVIKCMKETKNDGSGVESPLLLVLIDGRKMVHVGKLNWNFRGSQTIFIDGLVVDMMWDVEEWFFQSGTDRNVVFLFRTRSGADSRLWFEEKNLYGDHPEFSLVICGNKRHAD